MLSRARIGAQVPDHAFAPVIEKVYRQRRTGVEMPEFVDFSRCNRERWPA